MDRPTVHGWGINDADYIVKIKEELPKVNGKRKRRTVWVCPFYACWARMVERGFSKRTKVALETYKDVTVNSEWKRFSDFKAWMKLQTWEGMSLDKDILVQGNLEYSSKTCVFVPQNINTILGDCRKARGKYPMGVCYMFLDKVKNRPRKKPFHASITIHTKKKNLGYFETAEEAHRHWQIAKADYLESTVNEWSNDASFNVLAANALLERVQQLRADAQQNKETIKL